MRPFRPRSILQLTILGFLTVAAPLVAALVITVQQLDALGDRSQKAVLDAASAMRAGRMLVEEVLAMERNARQYAVLHDAEMLEIHADRHRDFLHAADVLRELPVGSDIASHATELIGNEERTYTALHDSTDDADIESALATYPALLALANRTALAVNDWIDAELLDLRVQVEHTQQLILIEALLLAGAALLMAGLFTALITRPLRQIDRAIHQLGDGDLAFPVNVQGPRDVEELGSRLEWLRTRLQDLEAQRMAFLRQVSHELKTPLTAIQEGVALLNERLVGPLTAQQGEITGILRNQCRRLQRLIDELLRFNISRLSAPEVEPRTVRLDSVVERVLSDHTLALQSSRLRIATRLEVLAVHGDPDRLRVIVDNLLTNAIKFSPPNATIAVALGRNGDRAVLDVSDEGPGIPPEERTLVFEPYYQGKQPDKRRFRGTGLGLAIARDYVQSSGGDIEILDAARGALFRVRFPLVEASPA